METLIKNAFKVFSSLGENIMITGLKNAGFYL
jgi:hypothetical protein